MRRQNGFALSHSNGGIILPSIRHNEDQVRAYAAETERHYDENSRRLTNKQLWKRCYSQGFRVVAVSVSSTGRGTGA